MNRFRSVFEWLFFLLPLLFLLGYPSVYPQLTSEALKLCATSVIPALFFYMVLTRFFSECGITERIGAVLSPLLSRLFRLPDALCGNVLLGILAGFPSGAVSIGCAYRDGKASQASCEHAVALCNNCSLSFILSFAGTTVFQTPKAGFVLLGAQLLTCLTNARLIAFAFHLPPVARSPKSTRDRAPFTISSYASSLLHAVSESAKALLTVTSVIVFFYTLARLLTGNFSNGLAKVVLSALFEMTSAVTLCRLFPFPSGLVMCAFCMGFSGLSVWFQVFSVCRDYGLSVRPFLFSRITGAVLMPFFTILLCFFLPRRTLPVFSVMTEKTVTFPRVTLLYAFLSLFVLLFAAVWRHLLKQNRISDEKIRQHGKKLS